MSGVRADLVIRQYQPAPARTTAEMSAVVESGFLPILQQVPGFREHVLVGTAEGLQSIRVFTDQAGAEESTWPAANRFQRWIDQCHILLHEDHGMMGTVRAVD